MSSFSSILLSLWEQKASGTLSIRDEDIQREIFFRDGEIAVIRGFLEEHVFLEDLVREEMIPASAAAACRKQAEKTGASILSSLLDLEILPPTALWEKMERKAREGLYPLFNVHPLESSWDPESLPPALEILLTIPALDLIHEGAYRTTNQEIIDARLPASLQDLREWTPDYRNSIRLGPHETYLLQALRKSKDLETLYSSSALGEKTTKQALYALLCLGILGPARSATPDKPLQEFTAVELHKILEAFNAKCSAIFKHVSKELGPVALNLLEKSVEEAKPHLLPFFQGIRLSADGRIDFQDVLKSNLLLGDSQMRQRFIKSLNEILSSEILAVKRTLGGEAESALIHHLEKGRA